MPKTMSQSVAISAKPHNFSTATEAAKAMIVAMVNLCQLAPCLKASPMPEVLAYGKEKMTLTIAQRLKVGISNKAGSIGAEDSETYLSRSRRMAPAMPKAPTRLSDIIASLSSLDLPAITPSQVSIRPSR